MLFRGLFETIALGRQPERQAAAAGGLLTRGSLLRRSALSQFRQLREAQMVVWVVGIPALVAGAMLTHRHDRRRGVGLPPVDAG